MQAASSFSLAASSSIRSFFGARRPAVPRAAASMGTTASAASDEYVVTYCKNCEPKSQKCHVVATPFQPSSLPFLPPSHVASSAPLNSKP